MKIAKIPIIDGDKLSREARDFLSGMAHGFDVRPQDRNTCYLVRSEMLTPDEYNDDNEFTRELLKIWDKISPYAFFMVCFGDDYFELEIFDQIEETQS